jgi:hypothetical protein
MEQYLIDTNSVSDYFSASFPENGLKLMDTVIDAIPNLSVITQIQLICWKSDSDHGCDYALCGNTPEQENINTGCHYCCFRFV